MITTIPTTEQTAQFLERIARKIAPYVALIIAAVLHTYALGYRLGKFIHRLNDKLAENWPSRPQQSRQETIQQPPIIAPKTAPESPTTAQKITIDTLEWLTIDLRAQGLSYRAIGKELGISKNRAAKIIRLYGSELINA